MEENVTVLPDQAEESLYSDVCQIIDGTRGRIATFLNTEVCMTNWYIGKHYCPRKSVNNLESDIL